MPEYVIGDFTFPTKKSAADEIRRILHDTPQNEPLRGDELDLILALIHIHPGASRKLGQGVAEIVTKRIDGGHKNFWIKRADGTIVDFSYLKALNGAPSPLALLKKALRREVEPDIKTFRDDFFASNPDPVCPLTGNPLRRDKTSHVDHIDPTFEDIAGRFIGAIGMPDLRTRPRPDGLGPMLARRDIADAWRWFHGDMARLRVIHASANMRRYRKPDPVPVEPAMDINPYEMED